MPSYAIDDNGIYYVKEGEEWVCLINFWDYYKNYGAIPIRAGGANAGKTIPVLLGELRESYFALAPQKNAEDELVSILAVTMVFIQGMRGYRPIYILKAGGGPAVSALLAQAARAAHQESRVYALTTDPYGERAFFQANCIGDAVENLFPMSIGPEDELMRECCMDMALLYGGAIIENPEKALQNALRLVRPGGFLICVTQGFPWLKKRFSALPGEAPEAYDIAKGNAFLLKRVSAGDYIKSPAAYERLESLHAKAKAIAAGANLHAPDALCRLIALLGEMETLSVQLFDVNNIDLKQRINEAKENALNCLYAPDEDFRAACMDKLLSYVLGEVL